MCFMLIEQPRSSSLYKFQCMADALDVISASCVNTFMAGFGGPFFKPTKLYTTFHNPKALRATAKVARQRQAANNQKGVRLTKSEVCRSGNGWLGRGWITGDKALQKRSAAYPVEFCEAVAMGGGEGVNDGMPSVSVSYPSLSISRLYSRLLLVNPTMVYYWLLSIPTPLGPSRPLLTLPPSP
eukprot:799666-Pyramimonas_sp.AAC.2